MVELDKNQEKRAFENIQFGKSWDLEKSVIIDTRSRFDFEMSKTPRSFHMFWKDWVLQGYEGAELERRKVELQRRLARKGVDPLRRIVIFGHGLKGKGEEMLIAALLFRLGLQKIAVVSPEKFKKSLLSKKTEPLASLPYWEKPLGRSWLCSQKKKAKPVGPKDFTKDLRLKKLSGPADSLKSPKGFWAYGAALQLRKGGLKACVEGGL